MIDVRSVLGQWVKGMSDVIWWKPKLMFSLIVIGNIIFMVAVEQVRLALKAVTYLSLAVPDLTERLLRHHFLFAAVLVAVVWVDLKLLQYVRRLVSNTSTDEDATLAEPTTDLPGNTGSGTRNCSRSFAQRVVYNLRATSRRQEPSESRQMSPERYTLAQQRTATPRRNPPRPNKYRPC